MGFILGDTFILNRSLESLITGIVAIRDNWNNARWNCSSCTISLRYFVDDPEERHDLASEQPEKLAELKARLDELMTSIVPPIESPRTMMMKLPVHETGTWSHGWC